MLAPLHSCYEAFQGIEKQEAAYSKLFIVRRNEKICNRWSMRGLHTAQCCIVRRIVS